MKDRLSSKAKFLLAAGLLAFVMVAMLGMGNDMKTDKNGNMEGCIFFTGKVMLCKMGSLEHISLWQSMFTAVPQESLILLALFILLVAVVFVTKNILAPPRLSSREALTKRLYLREHPDLLLFDPLKEAFSQGILNPKIYDFATL